MAPHCGRVWCGRRDADHAAHMRLRLVYDSTHDRWYTADARPYCQELINQYIADNHKEYYEGMVMSGAVTAIKAIKDDEQMYEMERTRMRAEARQQSATLPMYPEFVNKEQYSAMEHEDQLDYREAATDASEARRQLLVQTVGCTYSEAKQALRSGTKDLDKVVDHALYLSYMHDDSTSMDASYPNTNSDAILTLTEAYILVVCEVRCHSVPGASLTKEHPPVVLMSYARVYMSLSAVTCSQDENRSLRQRRGLYAPPPHTYADLAPVTTTNGLGCHIMRVGLLAELTCGTLRMQWEVPRKTIDGTRFPTPGFHPNLFSPLSTAPWLSNGSY